MSAIDTIVALATPPGRSGIGVIRLSGPAALNLARSLLSDDHFTPHPKQASLRTIKDPLTGDMLDRALVTYFQAPQSFTGEDVVEISCHGSPTLLLHVVDLLLRLGARAAGAGEFTLRALSHERLNLSQAEAIRDLIDAQTYAAVKQSARQLGGELSAQLQPLKEALLEVIVPLESSLEFVDDDLPEDLNTRVCQLLSELATKINKLAGTFRTGRLLKDGLRITLAGRPNVGKSSVFNSLVAMDRAIVTDIPGTTRDSLSELTNINGVPIVITDTAGVRDSDNEIERLGIERTRRAIADADLVIVVIDGSAVATPQDFEVLAAAEHSPLLVALNKQDLPGFELTNLRLSVDKTHIIPISAKTGFGLESLRTAILSSFADSASFHDGILITNARHFDLLQRSAAAIESSVYLCGQNASEELILVGLYDALRLLGEITGETTSDDILTQIFSTFCIGK